MHTSFLRLRDLKYRRKKFENKLPNAVFIPSGNSFVIFIIDNSVLLCGQFSALSQGVIHAKIYALTLLVNDDVC